MMECDTFKSALLVCFFVDPCPRQCIELQFNGVSLYFYLQNTGNSFNREDTYKELSSITFNAGLISAKDILPKFLKPFALDFNVAIELLASVMLIKAEKFEVDGITYKLVPVVAVARNSKDFLQQNQKKQPISTTNLIGCFYMQCTFS